MAEKLRLISSQIPWFLLLKPLAFAGSWLFLPKWLFVLLGVMLYMAPFFEPRRLWLPFVAALAFGLMMPQESMGEKNIFGALLLCAVFFLIIGIKELLFIRRFVAHQVLVHTLIFLACAVFFTRVHSPADGFALLKTFFVPAAAFFMLFAQLSYEELCARKYERIAWSAFAALLIWQAACVIIFLPLAPFKQAALAFIFSALLVEAWLDAIRGAAAPAKAALYASLGVLFAAAMFLFG